MLHFLKSFQDLRIEGGSITTSQNTHRSHGNEAHLRAIEEKIDSLYLMNMAALELLTDLGVSKQQVMDKIEEIDLRDGTADGKIANQTHCQDCGHKISKRRTHCFYCGSKVNSIGF